MELVLTYSLGRGNPEPWRYFRACVMLNAADIIAGRGSAERPSCPSLWVDSGGYQLLTGGLGVLSVREVVEGVAAACGATADLEIIPLTPALINDAGVAEVVRAAAEAVVGPENVSSGERTMGSEDAALFVQEVPGCYFFLGSANVERGLDAPHHNPRFDFDESALPLGVAVMMHALAHYLL